MTEKGLMVTKSNHLLEASYRLSLNEQRVILSAIVQLNARKNMPKDNSFTIKATDFARQFNIPLNKAYEALEDAATQLYQRDIKTYDAKAKCRERFRWVSGVKYWDGDGKVTLGFTNQIAPYLTMLEEQFTSYEIKQISNLKSTYSIRFYELLSQFLSTGERYITLEKLKTWLELQEKYTIFSAFRRRIIEPAMQEINETTDLKVEWDYIKKGSKITSLFFIFEKEKAKKDITEESKVEKKKPIVDLNTIDHFAKMTDAQRNLFASKLSKMPAMSKHSKGAESYPEFATRIAGMLSQPDKFKEFYPLLLKAGYK
jgi:plasmid replication initiation protein